MLPSKRLPELDALRGLAILLVVTWHYVINRGGTEPGTAIAYVAALGRLAWSGVDLFFVLSGFLLGGILLEARGAHGYFAAFYARRAFRILPLYALILISFWLLRDCLQNPDMFGGPTPPWWTLATFTQNFWQAQHGWGPGWVAVTWSLAIEEQFYLVLPLLIHFVSERHLPKVLLVCVVAAPVLRSALVASFGHEALMAAHVLMPCRMDALMLGVLVACALRRGWRPKRQTVLIACLVLGLGMVPLMRRFEAVKLLTATVGYTWVAAFYATLLVYVVVFRPRVASLRPLVALAPLAYFVYLAHVPIGGLVSGAYVRLGWDTVVAVVMVLSLASLSWRFVERPLIEIGRRFRYAPGTTPYPLD